MYPLPDETLEPKDLVDLVRDICECIECPNGSEPRITRLTDEILLVEIRGQKFRIEILDTEKFC